MPGSICVYIYLNINNSCTYTRKIGERKVYFTGKHGNKYATGGQQVAVLGGAMRMTTTTHPYSSAPLVEMCVRTHLRA